MTAADLLHHAHTIAPVIGLRLPDLDDPGSWEFDGNLSDHDRTRLREALAAFLTPPDPYREAVSRIDAELNSAPADVMARYVAGMQRRPVEDVKAELRAIALARLEPPEEPEP